MAAGTAKSAPHQWHLKVAAAHVVDAANRRQLLPLPEPPATRESLRWKVPAHLGDAHHSQLGILRYQCDR